VVDSGYAADPVHSRATCRVRRCPSRPSASYRGHDQPVIARANRPCRPDVTAGRSYPAQWSIGPADAHHAGHTDRSGPGRTMIPPPEAARLAVVLPAWCSRDRGRGSGFPRYPVPNAKTGRRGGSRSRRPSGSEVRSRRPRWSRAGHDPETVQPDLIPVKKAGAREPPLPGFASLPGGAGPCVRRGARALCGVSVREDLGLRVFFVHPGTPNPPASPNTPM
jgi:hypothetical protein